MEIRFVRGTGPEIARGVWVGVGGERLMDGEKRKWLSIWRWKEGGGGWSREYRLAEFEKGVAVKPPYARENL